MLTVFGILLIVTGAILTFAVDRQVDGVDLQAVGWILMGGGGLSLLAAMIRAAGWSAGQRTHARTERHVDAGHIDSDDSDDRTPAEDRRIA